MSDELNSAGIALVTAKASAKLRELGVKVASLEIENNTLREKIASMERDREIETIASHMEDKGLSPELSLEEKIAHLRMYEDLEQVKKAVEWAASGQIPLAKVADAPGRGTLDSLTQFCLTGEVD